MKFLITILGFIYFSVSSMASDTTAIYRDSLVSYAKTLQGIGYRYGGSTQKGFDCSGFVYYVYKHFNYTVPRTSSSYSSFGEKIELDSCQAGDVIVFTGTKSEIRKPGHIGIIVQNNNGIIDFIHASSSKKHYGVIITRYNNSGYERRFLSVKNVLND